ncbi:hypothetical protein NDU88_007180 [Pleurodeles waltl]|uniref:Uncharacterized protein n=1 Tax=Pleurodeles waltl TaxID=8319 RepID=A0AAV7LRB8_PLEWA|nr:hypothetical protein NDU88_007180 [Pleurodeles waltl]
MIFSGQAPSRLTSASSQHATHGARADQALSASSSAPDVPRRVPPASVRSRVGTQPLTSPLTTSLWHRCLTPKWRPPPPKSATLTPVAGSAAASSGPPPTVGAQPTCRADSFDKGPTSNRRHPRRRAPLRSSSRNSAARLSKTPHLGSPGAAPTPQRSQDPSSGFSNAGIHQCHYAAPAQAPPSAHASGPSYGSPSSEPRQAPPPNPPTGRAVPQLLSGDGRWESCTSACFSPPPVLFLPVLAA